MDDDTPDHWDALVDNPATCPIEVAAQAYEDGGGWHWWVAVSPAGDGDHHMAYGEGTADDFDDAASQVHVMLQAAWSCAARRIR